MNWLQKTINSIWLLLLLSLLLLPIHAQDDIGDDGSAINVVTRLGGGSTGIFNDDIVASPYFCAINPDGFCRSVTDLLSIDLIGVDYDFGWYAPNVAGALVSDWLISADNRVVTLNLRHDLVWSDGTPITSADVMMIVELHMNPEVNREGESGVIAFTNTFSEIVAPDDHTIVITFQQASCEQLRNLSAWLMVLPAHIYHAVIDEVDYAGLSEDERIQNSGVVSGAFHFDSLTETGAANLYRNDAYSPLSAQEDLFDSLTITHFQLLPEDVDLIDLLLAGELDVVDRLPLTYLERAIQAEANGDLRVYSRRSNNYSYIALNMANPINPQPAVDENGNRIDQGLHPVFGDRLVRQALSYATDVQEIIQETRNGQALRVSSPILSGSWADDPSISPIPYDPQHALELLAEAGWLPQDETLPTSVDNPLVCVDCLYAREVDSSYIGTVFNFSMLVSENDAIAVETVELMQQQFQQIGVTFEVVAVPFGDVVQGMTSQTYDAGYLRWMLNMPHDPNFTPLFGIASDVPGSGFNFTSFYNEALYALQATADTLPGCGLTERAALYHQMQRILLEDAPYIFLENRVDFTVARPEIQGIEPRDIIGAMWNIDTWRVIED